jgi:hypothetical protein
MVHVTAAGKTGLFNPVNNTWAIAGLNTLVSGSSGGAAAVHVGCYDWTNHRMVVMGGPSNNPPRVIVMTGAAGLSASSLTINGELAHSTSFGPALCWDPERGCFWGANLSSETNGLTPNPRMYLYQYTWVSALTLNCVRHTMIGTSIPNSHGGSYNNLPRGGYNKIGVLKGWDAIAIINRLGDPMYVVKKPA